MLLLGHGSYLPGTSTVEPVLAVKMLTLFKLCFKLQVVGFADLLSLCCFVQADFRGTHHELAIF